MISIQDEIDKLDRSVPGTSTNNNNDTDKDLNRAKTSQLEEQEASSDLNKPQRSLNSKSTSTSELQIHNESSVLTALQNVPVLTTLQNVSYSQDFSNSQEVLQSQVVEDRHILLDQDVLNRDGLRTEMVLQTEDPLENQNILQNHDAVEVHDVLQAHAVLHAHDALRTQNIFQELPKSPSTPNIRSIERLVTQNNPNEPAPQETCFRWLRSRSELEIKCTKSRDSSNLPIAGRLRSHNNSSSESPNSRSSTISSEKSNGQRNMIQIATSTLNKLLNVIADSSEVEVSVRESLNSSNNSEDISFLIELHKKQNSGIKVLAKVFPDQGSCLVDSTIVGLLKDQRNAEISEILKLIVEKSQRGISESESVEDEESQGSLRNPEDLFKMDGEEIHVDENVEQISANNQISYACRLCRKVYERRDKCTVHVKTHLGIKQYMCIVCNAKFVCKSDVMKHIRCSHTNPRPISCPKCPKRFRSKFDLAEHNNVHKGIKPYRCSDCDQTYHHKVSLQMHVKSHLPPQNLACEYCGKVFPYRTRLLSHVGSVHMKNRRNFRCHFCYNLYSSLSVLNDHIKTRHATTFTCETCSKTFKVASKYKAHVHQHTNPKPYVCTVCDNRYASKAFLNEHLLKHQGLRKHVCQKCGARFAQASHLAAHRHVHGEKTHACPECGKKFNRRDNMKVHRKRHTENEKKGGGVKKEMEDEVKSEK